MKFKVIFLLSIFLIIAASCQQTGTSSGKNDVVIFEFMPNLPPQDNIYEDQPFRVGLNVVNFEEDRKEVEVCVSDILGDFVSGIPRDVCSPLLLKPAYKSGDELIGWEESIYFPDKEQFYKYIDVNEGQTVNIYSDLYYKHETNSRSQICIKRDVGIEPKGITCELNAIEKVESNNAPVKVTRLEKNVIPIGNNKVNIILEMDIENIGSGEVTTKDDFHLKRDSNPLIDVDVYLKRERPLRFTCSGLENDKLIFRENQKTIICENSVDLKDEFSMEQIQIDLNYGYKLSKVTKTINLIDKDTLN